MLSVLQSFDLQRILEGEKAQRTEAARQLKDVEKRLALQRSPAVQLASPLPGASFKTADPIQLELDRARLQEQIKQHSAQVLRSCTCLAAMCGRLNLACTFGATGGQCTGAACSAHSGSCCHGLCSCCCAHRAEFDTRPGHFGIADFCSLLDSACASGPACTSVL